MKLQTSIKPRRDGTVNVAGLDGVTYTFKADETGDLVGDVSHEPTVAHLLLGGMFCPADESDYDRAIELTEEPDEADDDVDGQDDGGDGLPVESNTPVKVRRKPGPKPKAARE